LLKSSRPGRPTESARNWRFSSSHNHGSKEYGSDDHTSLMGTRVNFPSVGTTCCVATEQFSLTLSPWGRGDHVNPDAET
jgi:hypothetical protein